MRFRGYILAVLMTVLPVGCSIEPPLFLRKAVATEVQLDTKINVDVMWQIDWKEEWKFDWDTTLWGPLGYTKPASMRFHDYAHGPEGLPVSHTVHNFTGTRATVDVFVGTHNFLFHNNDSEVLLFRTEDELSDMYSYTREISGGLKTSSPVFTLAQKAAGNTTKTDNPADEPVAYAPDPLFSLYYPNRVITDNPEDYVYENGKYVLKIEGDLLPDTFIYLVQVYLLNNADRIVGSNGGAAITGMSEGVNLMTRESLTSTVSVPMDVHMDKKKNMLGARVLTFGIPGCNPYDKASLEAAPDHRHYFVLNISYINGSYRNIHVDITDQVLDLPLGGVITLWLDVNDFPPDESAGGGGGFNALISEWDEETGHTTITN